MIPVVFTSAAVAERGRVVLLPSHRAGMPRTRPRDHARRKRPTLTAISSMPYLALAAGGGLRSVDYDADRLDSLARLLVGGTANAPDTIDLATARRTPLDIPLSEQVPVLIRYGTAIAKRGKR